MKSKISFFNKTVFLKNVTLYWPVWGVYTIILLLMQPFVLWVNYVDILHYGKLTDSQKLSYLSETLSLQGYIVLIAFMAVITGMAVFSYLYNGRTANMIHSLPVDRTQLFGTNVISGLTFLAVPQVFTFFISMFVCLGYEVAHIEYLAIWLLLCFAIDFIFFGVVTFCAFFTGQLVTMPIYVIIVNGLSFLFYAIIAIVMEYFAYGVTSAGFIDYEVAKWFSPYMKIYEDVHFYSTRNDYGKITGMEVEGGLYLLLYVIVAAGLFAMAYFIYQKRRIEQAGELLTVEWVKPIFRWGVGTTGGFFCAIYMSIIFEQVGLSGGLPLFIILLLVIGVIFYFVADMFVKKTFRVFKKKNWKNCGLFSVCLLATFGALFAYAKYEENYIPDMDEIKSASVTYGYSSQFEGEDMQIVLDIHEEVLNIGEFEGGYNSYYDTVTVRIGYVLENDKTITRRYSIPYDMYDGDVLKRLAAMELEPDNFLRNQIGADYEKITDFYSGYIGFEKYDEVSGDINYITRNMTPEHCKIVYEAIIEDAKAGNIQKYNTFYSGDVYYYEVADGIYESVVEEQIYSKRTAEINLEYYASDELTQSILDRMWKEQGAYTNWYYDEVTGQEYYFNEAGKRIQLHTYLNFGPDCENVLNALVECGIIESADEIQWEYKFY